MSGIRLSELRKKAFNAFHEDGIIDITLGLIGLIWGFMTLTDDSSMSVLFIVLAPTGYWGMKQQYTIPRIGLVRFSNNDCNAPSGYKLLTAFFAMFIALGIVVFLKNPYFSFVLLSIQNYGGLLLGCVTAVIGAYFAWSSSIQRFYGYSILSLIILSTYEFLGQPFGYHMILLSTIMLLAGAYQLWSFTIKYPVTLVDGRNG